MLLHNMLAPLWRGYYRFKNHGRSCTEDAEERLKRRNGAMPEALSSKRQPISLAYDPTHDAAVPFLAKLPIEIRELIYTYALGNHLVHLLAEPRRITHFRCETSSVADPQRGCHRQVPSSLEKAAPSNSTISANLLRTNRQIYAEALPVLYSCNKFDVNDLGVFNIFANNISPAGLSSIRTVHLSWTTEFPPLEFEVTQDPVNAPCDDATYRRFWDIVTGDMPALREFRLFFATSWFLNDLVAQMASPWTQPIQRMRNLDLLGVALLEVVYVREDRQAQVDEFAARLGTVVCSEKGKVVTEVLHR